MKNRTLALTTLISLFVAAPGFAADIATGRVLAYDRVAKTLVLTDRTVWSLAGISAALPDNLSSGDRVQFSYQSDEEGIGDILEINIVRDASRASAPDRTEGEVLAYDRKANVLILKDKTAWSLDTLATPLPAAIKAGDRISIEYESDEEGVSKINDIRIITY